MEHQEAQVTMEDLLIVQRQVTEALKLINELMDLVKLLHPEVFKP